MDIIRSPAHHSRWAALAFHNVDDPLANLLRMISELLQLLSDPEKLGRILKQFAIGAIEGPHGFLEHIQGFSPQVKQTAQDDLLRYGERFFCWPIVDLCGKPLLRLHIT